MPDDVSDDALEDLRLFLAHLHGISLDAVVLHGVVDGEDSSHYVKLVGEAISRAWEQRGNRPLPPGYTSPHGK
jgi:hypothetical protein